MHPGKRKHARSRKHRPKAKDGKGESKGKGEKGDKGKGKKNDKGRMQQTLEPFPCQWCRADREMNSLGPQSFARLPGGRGVARSPRLNMLFYQTGCWMELRAMSFHRHGTHGSHKEASYVSHMFINSSATFDSRLRFQSGTPGCGRCWPARLP